jgi:hypothetical protein
VGIPERKRPLGRPRRRWVENIKMDLGEVGWGGVDWIGLAEDRNLVTKKLTLIQYYLFIYIVVIQRTY